MSRFLAVALGIGLVLSCSCPAASARMKEPIGKVRLPILSYTVAKSGPATGDHPRRSDTITVNYSLTLLNGTQVDGSAKRGKPDVFPLSRLIPAWQILLQKMRPGDVWTFYVPPEYAYGATIKEGLPANSFLIFKVELVSFVPTPA